MKFLTSCCALLALASFAQADVLKINGSTTVNLPDTVGYAVPEQFGEMMEIYRAGFSSLGLDYAVWGHISDGNVHPNVLPRSYDDVERGTAAILGFGREVTRLGGSPLAEHGVGRSPVKQMLLRQLYGDQAIDGMRAVKRALDPQWKLAPGVIFQRSLLT